MKQVMLATLVLFIVLLAACDIIPVPTVTPIPTATLTPTPILTVTPTASKTSTPTATVTQLATKTSTVTRTLTKTPTPVITPIGRILSPGFYGQYDYPCGYPLTLGTLPDGTQQLLCPNGLNSDGTYKNGNAFRTAGGMDWQKAQNHPDYRGTLLLGGVYWVSWADLNPSENVYRWDIIDKYILAAQGLVMETSDGLRPKGVAIKLFNSISNRPAMRPPVSGIDGGFILDDLTPAWVKGRMKGSVTWGGPTRLTGGVVAQDDGSYWVKASCAPYVDYQQSKPQGSLWNYSIWVVPKYDRAEWRTAAKKMLQDVSNHYKDSGITFIIGLNGVDGEHGNWLQNSYAGCGGLRASAGQQYPQLASGGYIRELPSWWNGNAMVGYSSEADPQWFSHGLFQARMHDDSPNFHRVGDVGVIDWPLKTRDTRLNAWENAYGFTDVLYQYQMFSLASVTMPRFFSLVGGSWNGDKALLRSFLPYLGRTITTTSFVEWKAYWTCFGNPDFIDCPDDPNDTGNWSQYMGWSRDIETGLVADHLLPFVNPWTELTAGQRSHVWAKMLRKLDTLTLTVDKWPKTGKTIVVKYLDVQPGNLILRSGSQYATIMLVGDGQYRTEVVNLPVTTTLRLEGVVYLHSVIIEGD